MVRAAPTAENHLKSIDNGRNGTFTYNAYGWRVYNSVGSVSYLLDPSGQFLGGRWNGGGNSAIPLGSRLLAEYMSNGADFDHVNVLGSDTHMTDWAGSDAQAILYYPWGQVWSNPGGNSLLQVYASLTLYDTVNNGYVPPFRYYVSNQGRWLTPDPLVGDVTNPQSLNRYAYVLNRPTTLTDPTGRCVPGRPGCKQPPTCYGMVCADQYYGGSNYIGFTSTDQLTCYQDGVAGNCGFILMSLQSGAVEQCPNNTCSYTNGLGQTMQFWAFAGAAGASSGYFADYGPGGLYRSQDEAGIASSEWGSWWSQNNQREVGGSLYYDPAGFYSSTIQEAGTAESFMMTTNFTDIPTGASGQGWWRSFVMGENSPQRDLNLPAGTLYTGTPTGRVLMFGATTGGQECILVGPQLSWLPVSQVPCH